MKPNDLCDIPSRKRPFSETNPSPDALPRFHRSRTSRACNACSKLKTRCETLAGDTNGCHRCCVIGIPCVFDREASIGTPKARAPGSDLPRNAGASSGVRPDRLHILASTTAQASPGPPRSASSHSLPSHSSPQSPPESVASTSKTQLSTDTIFTVGSTVFTAQLDHTPESELARFQADWKRWIAPLTQLQTLVRKNSAERKSEPSSHPQYGGLLSPQEETNLKNHFLLKYSPWLPAVSLGRNGSLDEVSPFLSAVIYSTAARTFNGITQSTIDRLRSATLNYVGLTFANSTTYPLIESLYALLILIVWPLDAADDVAVLMQGAKRMASSDKAGGAPSIENERPPQTENIDHIRLWYTIWANDAILTLGSGAIAKSPDIDDFTRALGTGSQIALQNGSTSDILLALEIALLKIITEAMRDRPFSLDKHVAKIQNTPEAVQRYMFTVSTVLTKLTHWEIEFYSIASDCSSEDAMYYAVLEIKYQYLALTFVVHATLMLSYVCPVSSAPEETRFNLWSWTLTINKSALAIARLFNKYTHHNHGLHDRAPSLAPFAVAPDRIFAMVVLSIMLLLRHQVVVAEYARVKRRYAEVPLGGFTRQADLTIRRVVERMREIGRVRGGLTVSYHPAAKYIHILEALLRCWDEKRAQNAGNLPPGGMYDDDEPVVELSNSSSVEGASAGGFGSGGAGVVVDPYGSGPEPLVQTPATATGPDQAGTGTLAGMAQWDIDLSLLGGDLFLDATAAFTYHEGMEPFDWAAPSPWLGSSLVTGDWGDT
ncbi:hypothetical protein BU17DRAFT_92021 [Hysterangium stoloniferum]|nr:hypothetical protein BU17DRAFT_92021 [Hysterangium stoloniferum]